MNKKSWVSHYIIPCPGLDRCEYYEPGESNHPTQHTISKVIYGNKISLHAASNRRLSISGIFLDNLAEIAYDPRLDPPNEKACFNCWRTNHLLKDCYIRKRYSFCKNCGRRNVGVENCPRCKKAYFEFIEEEDHLLAKIELYGDETSSDYYENNEKVHSQKEKSENCFEAMNIGNKSISQNDSSCKMRDESKNNQVNGLIDAVETINLEDELESSNTSKDLNKREEELKESTPFSSQNYENCTTSNTISSSTKIHEIEADATKYTSFDKAENDANIFNMNPSSEIIMEDEDYNDMIIDEDEKSIKSCETGDTLQLFINLLGTVKNLPIEAQNFAVGCFVKSHKQSR